MNRLQLIQICDDLGISLVVDDHIIAEKKGYYENYKQIENDGSQWCYSEVDFERRPSPEKEVMAKFNGEKEAIKYFFLNILKDVYSKKIYIPNNPVRKIHTLEELKIYFQSLGIRNEYYSFDEIRPQEMYAEYENDKLRVSYIGENMQKKFTTMPLEFERGLFVMYKFTYSLFLLKQFIEKNISNEKFDDNDVELFVK